MNTPNQVNHIAYCTGDMKEQLEFYTSVIGMKLKALFWMHGVEGAFHAFLELSPACCMSFVYHPAVEEIEPVMGVSHVPNTISVLPGGAHQHIAFNMENEEQLQALVDRVRSHGYMISDIIDHDFCKSVYMLAPENMWIEFTITVRDYDDRDIDAEVVGLCGINAEELAEMQNPDHSKVNEALLDKGKAQTAEMQKRMIEMIEQMKAKGQQKFETEYKHSK